MTTRRRSARPSPQHDVPTVDFYGDATPWSTSALVHSEPLIERSRLHAWKIRPHRHSSLAQLFWLRQGSGLARFDAEPYELEAPCVVVVPELCVHEFEWRRDCDGFALSVASSLVHELRHRIGSRGGMLKEPALCPAGADEAFLDTLFSRIEDEYVNERPLKESALDNLIGSLAIWIARQTTPEAGETEPVKNRARRHYERFLSLLERHHKAQWSVAEYADEIGITPQHLNAICRELRGESALRIVHDRLLLAARRELSYTDKSVADVAASLGFSEPSYFARFFKRRMSMTPKEYRRRSGTLSG